MNGYLGVAHGHGDAYASRFRTFQDAALTAVYDQDAERAGAFCARDSAWTSRPRRTR